MPIKSLSLFSTSKWTILARVTQKSEIRNWINKKGKGKLFNFELYDHSSEIRVTAFQKQCDDFYQMLQVDKVYYISKGSIKQADRIYNKLKHDYEITLNNETTIEECLDAGAIQIKYDFVDISSIEEEEAGSVVNVIAICTDSTELKKFKSKAGKDLTKREVTLVDQTFTSISLTLWNEDARKFDDKGKPVVLVKGAKVCEFQGSKNLSGGILKIDPDIAEGHRLREWFESGGENTGEFKSLSAITKSGYSSNFVSLVDARGLVVNEKPEYFSTVGMINMMRSENALYKACPNDKCNKKVIDNGNGMFHCDKCNMDVSSFKYRLLLNVSLRRVMVFFFLKKLNLSQKIIISNL